MKICKNEKTIKKNGVKDESLCFALRDLFCHLKCSCQWIMVIISFLLTLFVFKILNPSDCLYGNVAETYLSVFSSTLGLSIAAYAIVIGFQSETLKKLLLEATDKNKPFHIICASMIFNGLLQTLIIILSYFYQFCNSSCLFYFLTFFVFYSIIQIMDILLQLLGLRTFIVK